MIGTKKFDLMRFFDPGNLQTFKTEFLKIEEEYLEIYNNIGLKPEIYKTFEELYEHFMEPMEN